MFVFGSGWICIINFWIENDHPPSPPFWNFSENSSYLVAWPVPYLLIICYLKVVTDNCSINARRMQGNLCLMENVCVVFSQSHMNYKICGWRGALITCSAFDIGTDQVCRELRETNDMWGGVIYDHGVWLCLRALSLFFYLCICVFVCLGIWGPVLITHVNRIMIMIVWTCSRKRLASTVLLGVMIKTGSGSDSNRGGKIMRSCSLYTW